MSAAKVFAAIAVVAFAALVFGELVAKARREQRAACEVWRLTARRCDFCIEAVDRRPFGCEMKGDK